ncbi:hypothetical protein TI39_contig4321g00003 [Zymoseptoria brevis]|uniref:Telomere repeat-binding factor dimerisation domain-containing protein n=1 Tax=Zymoseptoria brevis TaxID=1047168 RepID=A0A0F4G7W7_9PEZI|nr:hypothetical protein TI39_contig4321g00003 [Zymoseptoria brevis]
MADSIHGSSHGRMNKRPRFEGPTPSDSHVPLDHYQQWNGTASTGFNPVSDVPPYNVSAEYNSQSASNPALNDHQQHWQQQVSAASAAYPDLASYQQQPYFYQQPASNPYQTSWNPAEQNHQPYMPANQTPYSNQNQAEPVNMPYFPPTSTGHLEPSSSADDELPTADYTSLEQASRNAQSDCSTTMVMAAQREGASDSSTFYFDDASMHLKIQSLSILDNLATQVIQTISKASYTQIQDLMRGTENEENQAYKTLKNLFNQTRKVYSSSETPFIDAIAIQMFQPTQQEIIRKANIATFISSILGAHDVSFFHLNEFFMETFVPLGHRLLKWQGAIYLELKTQTYISALMNSDGPPEAMLDELFPADLDAQILTRHPDAPSLSPSEQDFIDRSRARRSYLLAEPTTKEALRELPRKYQWADFVREFASCISKNVDGIMNVPTRSQALGGGAGSKNGTSSATTNQEPATFANAGGLQNGSIPGVAVPKPSKDASQPTTSKSAPTASAIRQPWMKPEEDALLSGLERVGGPHWSQILALYGRGGSVSEVLKDRNQVQLKDKARNLKLWYLKTGREVPNALRGVTGELRKRGGARAKAAMGLVDEEGDGDGEGGGGEAGGGSKKGRKKGKA